VRGVDLADGLDVETYQEVRAAFLQYGVLFFKEQSEISPAVHVAVGRMFGELHMHPAAPQMPGYPEVFVIHAHRESKVANGEFWHSDVSCDEVPPLGTMLQIHILPEVGGDTLFANMYAAYDALSAPMRQLLDGLTGAWGIKVSNVEIKHVDINESMVRAIARQAEAERERRAKVIHAEGELQASEKLLQAAQMLAQKSEAMQLRYLQTLTQIAGDKASTIVFPVPMDILGPLIQGRSPSA